MEVSFFALYFFWRNINALFKGELLIQNIQIKFGRLCIYQVFNLYYMCVWDIAKPNKLKY